MPTYWEFRLFAFVSFVLALWLGLRWVLLWMGRRQTKSRAIYGYPFLKDVRPNIRLVRP